MEFAGNIISILIPASIRKLYVLLSNGQLVKCIFAKTINMFKNIRKVNIKNRYNLCQTVKSQLCELTFSGIKYFTLIFFVMFHSFR